MAVAFDIVVNTAEHVRPGGIIARGNLSIARDEMDIRYFGMLRLAQAFGPALRFRGADGANSATAFVNLLSVHALMKLARLWRALGRGGRLPLRIAMHAGDFGRSASECSTRFSDRSKPNGSRPCRRPNSPPPRWPRPSSPPLKDGNEDIFVGDIAWDIRERLQGQSKALERELGSQ